MTADASLFAHADEIPPATVGEVVAIIPKGLRDEVAFFEALHDRLRLPEWCGRNFNALDECLRSEYWKPGGSRVLIVHEDVPLADDPSRATYLEVLADAMREASYPGVPRIRVVFPTTSRAEIERLCRIDPGGAFPPRP